MPKVIAHLYCTICLNDEDSRDWTSLIACGHLFHIPCVKKWVNPPPPEAGERRSKKPDWCPLCRTKILRPLGNRNTTSRENTRFRKLVFNCDVTIDASSSPARFNAVPANKQDDDLGEGTSKGRSRKTLIVSSSSDEEGENAGNGVQDMPLLPPLEDDEEAALQAILTESESDEENARPAQRVYTVTASGSRTRNTAAAEDVARQAPSLAREAAVNNNSINAMLAEARATIANKNAKIAELETTLDQALDNMRTALEARNLATGEQQIVEAMLRQRMQELKEAKDEITKLKEEKKGLSRTLRSEVARVGELNTSNRKLLDEITLLKQEHASLKVRHEDLEQSYNSTVDDLTTRLAEAEAARDASKLKFTRVHELNTRNEVKLNKKRERITNLEAELRKYRDAEEARRREKGKGRALHQDNDGEDQDSRERQSSFVAPRSRQISNRSIDDTSIFLDVQDDDLEESLLITQVPDYEDQHAYDLTDQDDEDAFADLDAVLSGPKAAKKIKFGNAMFTRDPLKEWTNSETNKSTTTTPIQQQRHKITSSSNKDGKKRSLSSISSASDKWADMAIYGRDRNGKNKIAPAAVEKTKTKTGF